MKTLIVDDHALFRDGLRLLLGSFLPLDDVQVCASGEEALACLSHTEYALILLDWMLGPGLSGTSLISALQHAQSTVRVIVVSGDGSPASIRLAIDSGAAGYIPKDTPSALLIHALRLVASGGIYLPPAAMGVGAADSAPAIVNGANRTLKSALEAFPGLTPRQLEVMTAMARGLPNKSIARELNISDSTVKQHLRSVFQALGVQNRTEVVYALAHAGVHIG